MFYRIPLGGVVTSVLIYCWIHLLEVPDDQTVPYYSLSVVLFGVSALLELLAEPLWIAAQYFLFIRLKVISEGLAMVAKCVVTITLVVMQPQMGLISFCIGQVI